VYNLYINAAPIRCNTPRIFSALKKRSAISPIIKGAIIAPHDWVENIFACVLPLALKLLVRKGLSVTNQPPQIKNSINIIAESWMRVVNLIFYFLCEINNDNTCCLKNWLLLISHVKIQSAKSHN